MEIKKFSKKSLNKFEFVNYHGYTRNGFYHTTTLFENGYKIANHKCNYINRTWECYTYQTVMLCAVGDLIDSRKAKITADYKRENGIKRLTASKKTEVEKIIKQDKRIKELQMLRQELKGNF